MTRFLTRGLSRSRDFTFSKCARLIFFSWEPCAWSREQGQVSRLLLRTFWFTIKCLNCVCASRGCRGTKYLVVWNTYWCQKDMILSKYLEFSSFLFTPCAAFASVAVHKGRSQKQPFLTPPPVRKCPTWPTPPPLADVRKSRVASGLYIPIVICWFLALVKCSLNVSDM